MNPAPSYTPVPVDAVPERKASLFMLTDDLLALDQLLDESGGEASPELEGWIAEYQGRFTEKVDNIGWFWRTIEARQAAAAKIRDEFAAKARVEGNKLDRLKAYIAMCLQHLNTRKVAGQAYTLRLQKNGGAPPVRLLIEEPAAYPEPCRKVVTTIDRNAVRAALEAGALPPGLAVLDPAGESVRLA